MTGYILWLLGMFGFFNPFVAQQQSVEEEYICEAPQMSMAEQPFLTGDATRYDYELYGDPEWSAKRRTCALRIYERYKTYKVCNVENWKCVECFHNDYGPKEYTNKVVDLSRKAFAQIANLNHGVIKVFIYKVD